MPETSATPENLVEATGTGLTRGVIELFIWEVPEFAAFPAVVKDRLTNAAILALKKDSHGPSPDIRFQVLRGALRTFTINSGLGVTQREFPESEPVAQENQGDCVAWWTMGIYNMMEEARKGNTASIRQQLYEQIAFGTAEKPGESAEEKARREAISQDLIGIAVPGLEKSLKNFNSLRLKEWVKQVPGIIQKTMAILFHIHPNQSKQAVTGWVDFIIYGPPFRVGSCGCGLQHNL